MSMLVSGRRSPAAFQCAHIELTQRPRHKPGQTVGIKPMNAQLSIHAQAQAAELAGDTATLAALVRHLLAERPRAPAPAKKRPAAVTRGAIDPRALTLTECRALGLTPPKEKYSGAPYVHVLVTFADGVQMLTGQYPRQSKDGQNFHYAIGAARMRRLLVASGGEYLKAGAKCSRVVSAEPVTDPAEIERQRDRCHRIRAALETFETATFWDGDIARGKEWTRETAIDARMAAGPEAPESRFSKALQAQGKRPAWWLALYGG